MKLSAILKDRDNGLTQSRILLSFFVLLDHQYALLKIPKPALLSGGLSLSSFAVYMFIFMSGLLCYVSRSRNSVPRFMLLRLARIFPGYVTCLAVTSTVFIPLLALLNSKGDGNVLQLAPSTLRASAEYFFGNLAFTQNIFLPASLEIANPIRAINGSLWTLQPEIMGYLLIAILFPLFAKAPKVVVALLVLSTVSLALLPNELRTVLQPLLGGYGFEIGTDSHLYLAVYLLSGILYAVFASKIDVSLGVAAAFTGLLAVAYSMDLRLFNIFSPLLLPYTFIAACWLIRWPWRPGFDWSYGVYLYSFPLQQITWSLQERQLISNRFWVGLLFVSLMAMLCGVLSYNAVENPSRRRILALLPKNT